MLEVVIHHALVVPCHSHAPLLELADYPLSALLGHSRYVALSARVLETQVVTIAHKDVSNGVKDWPRRRPSKDRVRIVVQIKVCSL